LVFTGIFILSLGLSYLIQQWLLHSDLPLQGVGWLAYLIVFGLSIIANLSVIVPVPLAASVMIAAATFWNPLLVALAGSLGGTIGELSGYYAGHLGKRLAIPDELAWYKRFEGWIRRWGVWAIALLAFQPIIPFDIGGFIAGTMKMPLDRFLPALWVGKFAKYLLLVYAGIGLIKSIPFFG
jgi:uncharacterized membrane protein YdjX (TVP38/TMEM64 family)